MRTPAHAHRIIAAVGLLLNGGVLGYALHSFIDALAKQEPWGWIYLIALIPFLVNLILPAIGVRTSVRLFARNRVDDLRLSTGITVCYLAFIVDASFLAHLPAAALRENAISVAGLFAVAMLGVLLFTLLVPILLVLCGHPRPTFRQSFPSSMIGVLAFLLFIGSEAVESLPLFNFNVNDLSGSMVAFGLRIILAACFYKLMCYLFMPPAWPPPRKRKRKSRPVPVSY